MKPIHQLLICSLIALNSCSRQAGVPVLIENSSEATLSNIVVVGLTHTNWIPPISPQMKCELGTVLPNAAGGFSLRFACEVGGKKLSHDTAHALAANIPAKRVFFTVETNLEVRCGVQLSSGRLRPTHTNK